MKSKARVIALYLPQYHPIPENDLHWGKGFTEWTNVAQAKPLYKGHYQPRIPKDLGFYDLRLSEIREAQASLAKEAGVEGFMYWHYWFGKGKMLLEKPFQEVLRSGKPDFPFCLGWANHSWTTKTWEKGKAFSGDTMIMEQKYPGEKDIIDHFNYLLPAFLDKRYITIDDKPVFGVYSPKDLKNFSLLKKIWTEMAIDNGLEGIHFVGMRSGRGFSVEDCFNLGYDAVNTRNNWEAECKEIGNKWIKMARTFLSKHNFSLSLMKYNYSSIIKHLNCEENKEVNVYPTIIPGFDRTARSKRKAVIYHGSTPELFYNHVKDMIGNLKYKPEDKKVLFLMSWNEWGEGNYMEPDLKFGKEYIKALSKALNE
jgi:hypothetical protein